jgi:hypothetical protein
MKNIKILLFIFFNSCLSPNYYHYSYKWTIIDDVKNDCVFESSISNSSDLLILYLLNLEKPKKLNIENKVFEISNHQILLEIYWFSKINDSFRGSLETQLGKYPIFNTSFNSKETPWIRLNDKPLISDYISDLDLFRSNNRNLENRRMEKTLIIFPLWDPAIHGKINTFLRKEFQNIRLSQYNCLGN